MLRPYFLYADWLQFIVNSSFFCWKILCHPVSLSILGPAFMTWIITKQVQKTTERIAEKKRQIEDINNINVLIMLSFNIWSIYIELKRNPVGPLIQEYLLQKERYEENRLSVASPNFTIIHHPHISHEIFQDKIFQSVSLRTPRAYRALLALIHSIEQLKQLLEQRNRYCSNRIEGTKSLDLNEFFGIMPMRPVGPKSFYLGLMTDITDFLDECIYFSQIIVEELIEKGLEMKSEFDKSFGDHVHLNVFDIDISSVKKAGLLPNPEKYKNWEAAF